MSKKIIKPNFNAKKHVVVENNEPAPKKLVLPAGMENGAPKELQEVYQPRVWQIIKREKSLVAINIRDMYTDTKLAAAMLVKPLVAGEIPKHFDEILKVVRKPKNVAVQYITIQDALTKIEVAFELINVQDEAVDDFVAGLNQHEAAMVEMLMKHNSLETKQ
jgi:hypothetical protein